MKVSMAYGKFQRKEQREALSLENRGQHLFASQFCRTLFSHLLHAVNAGRRVQLSQEIMEMLQKWKSGPTDQKCSCTGWVFGAATKTKHTLCENPTAPACLTSRGASSCCEYPPTLCVAEPSEFRVSVSLLASAGLWWIIFLSPPKQIGQWALCILAKR